MGKFFNLERIASDLHIDNINFRESEEEAIELLAMRL